MIPLCRYTAWILTSGNRNVEKPDGRRTSGNLLDISLVFRWLYQIPRFVLTVSCDVLPNEQSETGPTDSGCLASAQKKHREFEMRYSREQVVLSRCKRWRWSASYYSQILLFENGVLERSVLQTSRFMHFYNVVGVFLLYSERKAATFSQLAGNDC